MFRKDLMVFSKTVYESKISCISMSFKKEMDILRQIAKKLQTLHGSFGKTACPKCWIYGQYSQKNSPKNKPKIMPFLQIPNCEN